MKISRLNKKILERTGLIVLFVWLAVSWAGCNKTDKNDPLGPTTPNAVSARITITPANPSVDKRGTIAFAATGGSGTYTWRVSDSALGSINSSTGAFTAGDTGGTVTVTATDSRGAGGTATVIIAPQALIVTPSVASVTKNGTQTFTATGVAPFFWNLSNATIGSIGTTTGIFSAANTTGTSTVFVTDSRGATGSASVTVINPQTLTVSPVTISVPKNGTQTFTANGRAPFTWSISNSTVGSIGIATGIFTASNTTGSATISVVDASGNTGTASVTVINVQVQLVVSPAIAQLPKGGRQTFTATGGTAPLFWAVSNTLLGSIGFTTGTFTADNTLGTTTITVTDSLGNTGSASVTIIDSAITVSPGNLSLSTLPGQVLTYTAAGAVNTVFWTLSGATGGYVGATINTLTGQVTITTMPVIATHGNQALTITATDGTVRSGTATLFLIAG